MLVLFRFSYLKYRSSRPWNARLCLSARDYDVPLEINCLGIREKHIRCYPSDRFFTIAGEVGAPVTIGFDAHDPDSAYDGTSLVVALRMIDEHRLNYIARPKLRLLGDPNRKQIS